MNTATHRAIFTDDHDFACFMGLAVDHSDPARVNLRNAGDAHRSNSRVAHVRLPDAEELAAVAEDAEVFPLGYPVAHHRVVDLYVNGKWSSAVACPVREAVEWGRKLTVG